MNPTTTTIPVAMSATREWVVVGAMTLVAAGLRLSSFGRLGLTHFDEGVYALAGLWAFGPKGIAGIDPQVIAYAPPIFPILVGLSYRVLGVSDASALIVPVCCGVLTVPVSAWVGRRTFGRGAGAASATFAALAMAHVAFSRKALTDVPYLLAWLSALGLGGWFLERPRTGRAILFGMAVGLAQNLKYNGWIAVVVVALSAVFGLVASRDERRPCAFARTFGLGLFSAAVVAGCYWPWYAFVEAQRGGYASLIRHQRSYIGGLESWRIYLETQLAQAVSLSGGIAWCGFAWAAAWLAAAVVLKRPASGVVKPLRESARQWLGLFAGGAVLALIPDLGWWAGLLWLPKLLTDPRPSPRVLAAWWLILSVMTPFYHPYARLWLPLHASGWLLLAGVVVHLKTPPGSPSPNPATPALKDLRAILGISAVAVCLVFARGHWLDRMPRPFPVKTVLAPTDDLRKAVAELYSASPFPVDGGVGLRVLGRRPLAFYLGLDGAAPVRLMADLRSLDEGDGSTNDWALVDEASLARVETSSDLPSFGPRWSRQATWSTRLDPVTLLDVNPGEAYEVGKHDQALLVLLAPGKAVSSRPSGPRPNARAPNGRDSERPSR